MKLTKQFIGLFAALFLCSSTGLTAEWIVESPRQIPVAYDVDVLVVGGSGGAAAAALSAAKQGAKVLLIANRSYLGEDICGTYRLWLEDGEHTDFPLAQEVFRDPFPDEGLPFTYTAVPSASPGKHPDTDPPSRLAGCATTFSLFDCVEYGSDAVLTLDLGKIHPLKSVKANLFQKEKLYKVKELTVSGSDDGKNWISMGNAVNTQTPDNNDALALTVPLTGSARYLKLQYHKADNVGRIIVSRIVVQSADLEPSSVRHCPTPLHVKRTLEQELLRAKIEFLFNSYPSEVFFDDKGQPAGIIMANRNGRQAIRAKTIIDATPRAAVARMAGAQFSSYPAGPQTFQRVVAGGSKVSGPAINSVRTIPAQLSLPERKELDAYEYTLQLDMKDGSWASFAKAEQLARDATWTKEQNDSSEMLFQVPPDPMKARKNVKGDWIGAAKADLDAFRPQSLDRLYVLGGCANISREAAARLLRPAALMELGDRIGAVAAKEAAAVSQVNEVRLAATTGRPTVGGDLKELLTGVRPTQKGLPVIHTSERVLPVLGEYDVIVVGGGTAGAPAGIAAARNGSRTLVIESLHALGGVATLGLIGVDFCGYRQGFTGEMAAGLRSMGEDCFVPRKSKTWNLDWKMEWLRRELENAGGELWIQSTACGAVVENGKVKGVAVATPQGWGIVLAKTVIDATGSSDIAIAAGADYVFADKTVAIQGTGLSWRNIINVYQNGWSRFYTNTDYTFVDDTDMVDVWRVFLEARDKFNDRYDVSQIILSRERRRIVGDYTVTPPDIFGGRTYDDTLNVTVSAYDSHGFTFHPLFMLMPPPPSGNEISARIPYRALLPKNLEGVLVVGLGISAHRDTMGATRVIPDIQNQGYAAGMAAATAAAAGCGLRQIDIKALQNRLIENGILPKEVLSEKDNFAVGQERLLQAVEKVQKQSIYSWDPVVSKELSIVLAHWNEARPLLQQAYLKADNSGARLTVAHILGIMGDATGADALLEKVSSTPWDKGWRYAAGGQFGASMSHLDSYIIALGRTRDPRATGPLTEKVRELKTREFSHYRAVAMALEALGDPAGARPLATLLKRYGISGNAVTLAGMRQTPPIYDSDREDALQELILAGALYRLGDYQGTAYSILKGYEADIHGYYSRYAQTVLNEKLPARPAN